MLNVEQLEAFNIIKTTNDSIFITGPPGVGKSYLLNEIVIYFKQMNIKYGITASTGCAAILINGQTLHSYLGIGLAKKSVDVLYNNACRNRQLYNKLRNLEVLIIDEISMIDINLFEKISEYLSKINNNKLPFGNIRLILIGDFCQLPPINGDYCFKSKIWSNLNIKTVQLKSSMRHADEFLLVHILDSIRKGRIDKNIYNKLLELENTEFKDIVPTKLYCLKKDVDEINERRFDIQYALNNNIHLLNDCTEHKNNNTIICYSNSDTNNVIKKEENNFIYEYKCYSSDLELDNSQYSVKLIKNAQVMITRNINLDAGLVNGKRGVIVNLTKTYVIISDIDNKKYKINYYTDENINNMTYTTFMPLTLAYAITVHKSQGCTIDAVQIDSGQNNFAPGQFYTALSRAKSLKHIKLVNLHKDAFIINKDVDEFYKNI